MTNPDLRGKKRQKKEDFGLLGTTDFHINHSIDSLSSLVVHIRLESQPSGLLETNVSLMMATRTVRTDL